MNAKRATYLKIVPALAFFIFLLNVFSTQLWQENSAVLNENIRHGTSHRNSNTYAAAPSHVANHFPPPDDKRQDYREWNVQTLRELHTCMALRNCGANQQKVALLAAHWFEEAVVRGWRGGEGVWGLSVYKNLRRLGYTTLFANSFEEALQQYRMFPDLVQVVIRNRAGECHQDAKCVKGPTNPTGIPAWKIFDFEFFASHGGHFHASLMKGKWILSANPDRLVANEADSPIQYIGYSIQEDCQKVPAIPLADRAQQVWMLMKQLTYVYDDNFAWNRSYFTLAANELGLDFVGGWQINQRYGGWNPDVRGPMVDIEDRQQRVINLGQLNQTDFMQQVGLSKVMVGVGGPWWSPSPYNSLCQGVPFINPILRWKHNAPWDKSFWYTQHPSLNRFDPPYVYNVHARDWDAFVDAVKAASTTEIPSFIPDHMTEVAVQKRLEALMETDWRSAAAVLLQEREEEVRAGKEAYVFEL